MRETPGEIKNEINITYPTQEDIKNSDTLYIFVENIFGYKQFVPISCKDIKELVILTDKEEALTKCGV